eukprot:gene1331-20868_t
MLRERRGARAARNACPPPVRLAHFMPASECPADCADSVRSGRAV